MLTQIIAVAAVAAIFYLAAPLVGAFRIRREWRKFRSRAKEAFSSGDLSFGLVAGLPDGPAGAFRCYGRVDAIGDDDKLWIRYPGGTCVIEPGDEKIILLPSCGSEPRLGPADLAQADETIDRVTWSSVASVAQDSLVFVGGTVTVEDGQAFFRRVVDERRGISNPFIVFHDGRPEDVLPRLVWAGRHKNEYWNQFTQISLATGVFVMSAFVYSALSGPIVSLTAALVITLAFAPLLPVLPPGAALFLFYRKYWKAARVLRAERDFAETCRGDGAAALRYAIRARKAEFTAIASFIASLAINFPLFFFLLRRFLR